MFHHNSSLVRFDRLELYFVYLAHQHWKLQARPVFRMKLLKDVCSTPIQKDHHQHLATIRISDVSLSFPGVQVHEVPYSLLLLWVLWFRGVNHHKSSHTVTPTSVRTYIYILHTFSMWHQYHVISHVTESTIYSMKCMNVLTWIYAGWVQQSDAGWLFGTKIRQGIGILPNVATEFGRSSFETWWNGDPDGSTTESEVSFLCQNQTWERCKWNYHLWFPSPTYPIRTG